MFNVEVYRSPRFLCVRTNLPTQAEAEQIAQDLSRQRCVTRTVGTMRRPETLCRYSHVVVTEGARVRARFAAGEPLPEGAAW